MWVGLLFACLGVFGSALPGHLFMRVLAHREQLDRQLPFAAGTENSGLLYGWWLMRYGQHQFPQARVLNQFGNLAAIFGWISLLASVAAVFSFIMSKV